MIKNLLVIIINAQFSLMVIGSCLHAQELLPLEESYKLQKQINKIRKIAPDLKYDSTHQGVTDKYALTRLVKNYRHSSSGNHSGENIIAGIGSYDDFFHRWKMSPGHRKNMKTFRYRSMCARIVKSGDTYYGVVRFYTK